MECPLGKTHSSAWKDVIPHRSDVLLEDIDVFKDDLVVTERKNGFIQLRIRSIRSGDGMHFCSGWKESGSNILSSCRFNIPQYLLHLKFRPVPPAPL